MLFTKLDLSGAYLIDLEGREDNRGFFARTWDANIFEQHGIETRMAQANLSFSHTRGTLRGMHYQRDPYAEAKLVRCVRGALYDVIIDLRPASPTYMRWVGIELSAENRRALFVPEGFAHGFQTLTDNCEALYQVSAFYTPGAEGGVRYNDPAFNIQWPLEVSLISDKDRSWPDFAS